MTTWTLAELIWWRDFYRRACNFTRAAELTAELRARGFTA